MCLACRRLDPGPLCRRCRDGLRSGGRRRLEPGVVVSSAYLHDGPARLLVHRLKYEGVRRAAGILAEAMAPLLPPASSCIVPVPRVVVRSVAFGLDPGRELALAVGAATGVPVLDAFSPAVAGPRHAGRSRGERMPPRLRLRRPLPAGAVLVDDVVTTGMSLSAAAGVAGFRGAAVTATGAAGRPTGPIGA